MPPEGGPADKTAPVVAATAPKPGSVNHPLNSAVVLTFSEWILPRNAERSVTIFPPLPGGHRIVVKGKVLEVQPVRSFADSTTYHVQITTGLQDLHGNPIGVPYQLVFSTGDHLDSCHVSGCVIDPLRPILQPKVALFAARAGAWSDSLLFGPPNYLVQTDSFGAFAVEHIRPGEYEVVAFDDGNSDSRLQPLKEQAYAGQSRRITVTGRTDSLLLFPVRCDTSSRRVTSLRPVSATLAIGEWSRPAMTAAESAAAAAITISCVDASRKAPAVTRYMPIGNTNRFAISLSPPLERTGYRLIYRRGVVMASDSASTTDTLRFNGTSLNDTAPPKLSFHGPRGVCDLSPVITTVWSEPVRITIRGLAVADTAGDTVVATCDSAAADTVLFRLARRLRPGRRYQALLPYSSVRDLSGNAPADTADSLQAYRMELFTVDGDSLCVSLSGCAPCLRPDPQRRWFFLPFGAQARYASDDSGASFRFDSIPAARGRLAWLVDRDGNGARSPAFLIPWVAPEPYVVLTDTVEARARWEIEGLTVRACGHCQRVRAAPPSGFGRE